MANVACLAGAGEAVGVIVAVGAGGVVAAELCAIKQHFSITAGVTPAPLSLGRSG